MSRRRFPRPILRTTFGDEPEHPAPDYPEYEGLLALAEESVRRDGWSIDPVKMRMWQSLPRDRDWSLSVVGHGRRDRLEIHMLLLAHGQDIDPPMPLWLAEVRAYQEYERREADAKRAARIRALDDEWRAIWENLGFEVRIAYNYSGGLHLESYCSGAVHIIAQSDVKVGRLARAAGTSLCWTPSTAGHLLFGGGDCAADERRPTCKACIRTAAKLAGGKDATALLAQPHH